MISEHRVIQLRTTKGEKLEAEVNYSGNEKVKDCQVIRFKIDSKEFEIKRDDLVTLMLIFGTEEHQKKMLPMQVSKVREVQRLLTFEWVASQNYNKGEKITVKAPWIDQQVTEDEVLSGSFNKRKTKYFNK